MTSLSSGYMTVRRNLSPGGNSYFLRYLPVPIRRSVMLSFKLIVSRLPEVKLYCHCEQFDHSLNSVRVKETMIWENGMASSHFAHIYHARKLTLTVRRNSCIMTQCFQMFFTFFPESNAPKQMSSGFWNCSVDGYSSFRHHMECNLKTECEDGRDETEHCPFSSPDCQGMIAMCGRCYSFVREVPGLSGHTVDISEFVVEHCHSLGGTVNLPVCAFDWLGIVLNITGLHGVKLSDFWVGFHSNDRSLPPMYIHEFFQGRSLFFHSVRILEGSSVMHSGAMECYHLSYFPFLANERSRCVFHSRTKIRGIVCAFSTNRTSEQSLHIKPVSLNNTHFVLSWRQDSMTSCSCGHVTYTVLLCGSHQLNVCSQQYTPCHFNLHLSHKIQPPTGNEHTMLVPTFACNDHINEMSYSLVCNFISDCQDSSDESFCSHPVCMNMFTCTDGQCVSYTNVCDQTPQCPDQSDEHICNTYRIWGIEPSFFPSPALVNFDGIMKFSSIQMDFNESCPDSHYRCPGDFNDCLPVYTRCNGMYDCLDRMDEEKCEEMRCPGFFRCRTSTTCLHTDHLCDGWPHCLMHDDEMVCDTSCPVGCLCQGHTFLCHQPFSTSRFLYVRSLDGTSSGITLSDVSQLTYLVHLVLARCSLTIVPAITLLNLKFLDLSENNVQLVNMTAFLGLYSLQTLSLSNNPITSLSTDLSSVAQHRSLLLVDLSFTALTVYDSHLFVPFIHTHTFNLSFTAIHTISPSGFHFTPQLTELYMYGSPLVRFPPNMFKDLSRLSLVETDNYKVCCPQIFQSNLVEAACHAPKNEISSCEDLLQSWFYRGFLWLINCLSVSGNVFCFCARLVTGRTSASGFSVFVLNLMLADFLMGVYIAIIGAADEQFRGRYLQFDDTWKNSAACKVAGSLCLLSSEVSALIIWLITLDRFLVIHFPFSTLRFGRMSGAIACLLTWSVGWSMAVLPSLPVLSHWEFYSQTSICIPLPVTKQDFEGKQYSFSLLIVLNFILFVFICVGQTLIYWSIQKNAFKKNTTKLSRDVTIAQRLISVAVTDFLCWFPIGLCGMLALAGTPIPGEVNVALAIFVLPLNSAINPFMYTFNTLAEKRRKSNEVKLLQWLESQSDMALT